MSSSAARIATSAQDAWPQLGDTTLAMLQAILFEWPYYGPKSTAI